MVNDSQGSGRLRAERIEPDIAPSHGAVAIPAQRLGKLGTGETARAVDQPAASPPHIVRMPPLGRWYLLGMIGVILVIVGVTEFVVMSIIEFAVGSLVSPATAVIIDTVAVVVFSAVLLWLVVVRKLVRDVNRERAHADQSVNALRRQTETTELVSRLMRGMDICVDEDDVLELTRVFLSTLMPQVGGELLLADSNHVHMRAAVPMCKGGPSGCDVDSPSDCPAVRSGQGLTFTSSLALDACPKLRGRDSGPLSAVCLPISVLGRIGGVMHAAASLEQPPTPATIERLSVLSSALGNRISMIRALTSSQFEARVDHLTGLANRRWFEATANRLEREHAQYSLVVIDVDNLKAINDCHGHVIGDQVLALLARVLRDVIRRDDFAARIGGDEFALIMVNITRERAPVTIERLRTALAQAFSDGTVPAFTVSAGVSDSGVASVFAGVMSSADDALYRAKKGGRDRVEVAA